MGWRKEGDVPFVAISWTWDFEAMVMWIVLW
jgi:hypothetical protein